MSKKTKLFVRLFSNLSKEELKTNLNFFMDRNKRFGTNKDQIIATKILIKNKKTA